MIWSIAAARRLRRASAVLNSARASARLLDVMPARPLLVRPDGRIEVDQRLLRELGIDRRPCGPCGSRHARMTGSRRTISTRWSATSRRRSVAGASINRNVRAAGSGRVFDVRGAPAPPPEPAGTMLLWFFDTSASEEERSSLALRLRQTEGALDSLTHLIESAPFPMWYRGPDLKLGLVNSAFVEAVEGTRCGRRHRAIERADRRAGREQRAAPRRSRRSKPAEVAIAQPGRRSSAASGACCGSSTCRCRPARSPASRSTSRTSRTRGPSLRATSNRSASWPTG